MPGIGVVLNPHSKRYRRHPEKLRRMGFIVGERGSCAETNNFHDIRLVAEEFKRKRIDILALSGGDGTNHVTLSTFIEVYGNESLPKITFLRGGTLNTIASACGVYGTPEKILTNLLYKYHQDDPFEETKVRLIKVNRHYGFIWGCGVISRFMEAYYEPGRPSQAMAAWTLGRSIGSAAVNGPFACRMFERMEGEVAVNGKTWPFKNYSAVFAGSVPYLGLGFRVFYLAGKGKFHAIAFTLPPRNVLRHVPFMLIGRPSGCRDLLEEPAEKMEVRLAEPVGYTIDGDMHSPVDRFTIEPGPCLDVVVR